MANAGHINYEDRLILLRKAELGAPLEMAFRYGIMLTVSVFLYFTLPHVPVLTWAVIYFGLDWLNALILLSSSRRFAKFKYALALLIYTGAGLAFLWMPLTFLKTETAPHLVLGGACGIVGLALYTLQRTSREIGLMLSDCIQMLVAAVMTITAFLPGPENPAGQAIVLVLVFATYAYYGISVVSGYRQQTRLKNAEARNAALQKDRALAQFVGGVAHDFNNQLTAILGNLELAELLDTPKDRDAAMQQCRAGAEHVAATVRQLLAASGRTRLSPVQLSLTILIKKLIPVLTDLMDPSIVVETRMDATDLTVLVDADMLESSLIQLCLNAQDAMPQGGRVIISIRQVTTFAKTSPGLPPNTYAELSVEDTGPGVSADNMSRLAEPFFTTKPVGDGAGLGLSAVAGFAQQSGGALVFQDSSEGGLHARILLPLAQ